MSKSYKKRKTYFEEEDFQDDDQGNRSVRDKKQRKLTDAELLDLIMKEGFGG